MIFVECRKLRENGDTTLAMCIFDISHLIQNFKRCSKLEVVHAISLQNLLARKEGIEAKNEATKDIFNKKITKITTSDAITERINQFGVMKESLF